MSRSDHKPTSYYHLAVCRYAESGYRKRKDGVFHGEPGTFLGKDAQIVFVGWSGRVVTVE